MPPRVLVRPTRRRAHGQRLQHAPRPGVRVKAVFRWPSLGFKERQVFFIPPSLCIFAAWLGRVREAGISFYTLTQGAGFGYDVCSLGAEVAETAQPDEQVIWGWARFVLLRVELLGKVFFPDPLEADAQLALGV